MEFNQEIIHELEKLRKKRKFADSDWDERGLIPSDSEKAHEMAQLMDICIDELLSDIKSGSTEKQVKKSLIRGLKRFKTIKYDTEEKEFIGDEFYEISSVLGLNISSNLTIWRYGIVLGTIISLVKRK